MTEIIESAPAPDPETLELIVGDVFAGLLGDVEPPFAEGDGGDPLPVLARVSVTGTWNGEVVVECSTPLARLVTSHLLLVAIDELADDDVRDVVGELVNVIGGNVKSVMPGPSTMSLPQSLLDGEHVPGAEARGAASAVRLAWREEPLRVSVFTQGPAIDREQSTEVGS
jgi:chemotaxis protein CheX